MIDFALDEPLALLAEAFGHEPDSLSLLAPNGEIAAPMMVPNAAVIPVAALGEIGVSATHAD